MGSRRRSDCKTSFPPRAWARSHCLGTNASPLRFRGGSASLAPPAPGSNRLSEVVVTLQSVSRLLPSTRHEYDRALTRPPYPGLVGHLAVAAARVQLRTWDAAVRDVRRVQEATLRALLAHAEGT